MNVLLKYCFSKTLMVLSRIAVVSEKNIFQTTHVAKKKNKIQNKKKQLVTVGTRYWVPPVFSGVIL